MTCGGRPATSASVAEYVQASGFSGFSPAGHPAVALARAGQNFPAAISARLALVTTQVTAVAGAVPGTPPPSG